MPRGALPRAPSPLGASSAPRLRFAAPKPRVGRSGSRGPRSERPPVSGRTAVGLPKRAGRGAAAVRADDERSSSIRRGPSSRIGVGRSANLLDPNLALLARPGLSRGGFALAQPSARILRPGLIALGAGSSLPACGRAPRLAVSVRPSVLPGRRPARRSSPGRRGALTSSLRKYRPILRVRNRFLP